MKNKMMFNPADRLSQAFFEGLGRHKKKGVKIGIKNYVWGIYLLIVFISIILSFSNVYFLNVFYPSFKNHMYGQFFLISQVFIDVGLFFSMFFLFFMEKKMVQDVAEMTCDLQERGRELNKLAHIDTLTALPNRHSFIQELDHRIAKMEGQNSILIVGLIDIDDFSRINDTYGYQVGDELLKEVSRVLGADRGADFYLARLFADEFGFSMMGAFKPEEVEALLESMLRAFDKPLDILGREIKLSISIGLVSYQGTKDTSETLLVDCDIALYCAKTNGRNRFKFFTKEIRDQVERRHAIDYAMQLALDHQEFEVFYQPQVDVQTKQIVGLEALLRWHSRSLGEVSSDEFIPIAESNRLILKLGRFVLSQAILDFLALKKLSLFPDIKLSVNVSTLEIRDPEYLLYLTQTIDQERFVGSDLYLEITESILIEKVQDTVEIINQIKKVGVKFALDDFGTGYSSMKYLKSLSVELLKIDQYFIKNLPHDPENCTIVKSMIDLAHHLKIKVLAEGVETQEQFEYLKAVGCDQAQGFYFYRPMNFHAAQVLISQDSEV